MSNRVVPKSGHKLGCIGTGVTGALMSHLKGTLVSSLVATWKYKLMVVRSFHFSKKYWKYSLLHENPYQKPAWFLSVGRELWGGTCKLNKIQLQVQFRWEIGRCQPLLILRHCRVSWLSAHLILTLRSYLCALVSPSVRDGNGTRWSLKSCVALAVSRMVAFWVIGLLRIRSQPWFLSQVRGNRSMESANFMCNFPNSLRPPQTHPSIPPLSS